MVAKHQRSTKDWLTDFRYRQSLRLSQVTRDKLCDLAWLAGGKRHYERGPGVAEATAHRWCFVVGCNNSGTSLVHKLLESTGRVSSFELEGQRYTKTLARAARRGHERVWSEFLDELRLTEEHSAASAPRLMHDWMRELELPIKELIVEKTTANAVRMRWLARAFPNHRFVAMVRDGYAVVEGTFRKGTADVARAARHWNLVNQTMLDDLGHLESVYLLKYEDLVDDRERVCVELGDFLAIPAAEIAAGFEKEYEFVTLDGRKSGVQNMNAASWSRLSAEDIEIIRKEAGVMLDHFGYSITL